MHETLHLLSDFATSKYFTCSKLTIVMNKLDEFIGVLRLSVFSLIRTRSHKPRILPEEFLSDVPEL